MVPLFKAQVYTIQLHGPFGGNRGEALLLEFLTQPDTCRSAVPYSGLLLLVLESVLPLG